MNSKCAPPAALALIAAMLLAVSGCTSYHPRPLSPEQTAANFDARWLQSETLHQFFVRNGIRGTWPRRTWNLHDLTLAAFYYQPALTEARAHWDVVHGGEITAGEHPNPTVTVTPAYDSQIPGTPSPWIVPLTFDVPIETAGKRSKRIEQAKHLSEAERWNLVSQIWTTRSHVRAALLALYAAQQNAALLAQQEKAQSDLVHLLEGQVSAGSIAGYEVMQSRTTLETTQLSQQDSLGQIEQARSQLANAIGVPLRALKGVEFSFSEFEKFPQNLTARRIRKQALFNRADVRSALAKYTASQSALQLEIANQYPDIHLGPGYGWNSGNAGDNQWELGLTVTLPLLNQNQGKIAETKAARAEAAAHFLTVQSTAISEIESALSAYKTALKKCALAKKLLVDLQKQSDSAHAQVKVGEADAQTLANSGVELAVGRHNVKTAEVQAQQALGQLEDAVQSPVTLSDSEVESARKENHAL